MKLIQGPNLNAGDRLRVIGYCLLLLGCALCFRASAQSLPDSTLAGIRFDQKLQAQVSPTLLFHDEEGEEVRLGQYFAQKPVLLILGYYECPMLCTLVLNGMVESAADMKWSIGREFEVIAVSINPKETSSLAATKKRTYLKRYGRAGASQGWHFLTGSEPAIQQLADEVGFRYAYDPVSRQYAHASGLIVLTPQGKVSSYLFGVTYPPKDLYAALLQASSSRFGLPVQQFILLCFHYNPITGKYSGIIIVVVRLLAGATVLGLLWLIVGLVRAGRTTQPASAVSARGSQPLSPRGNSVSLGADAKQRRESKSSVC